MREFFIFLIFVIMSSIPLTLIGTYHARKMAEINRKGVTSEAEARLENEIRELRQLVTQQAIALDDLSSMYRRLLERAADDSVIKERLHSK